MLLASHPVRRRYMLLGILMLCFLPSIFSQIIIRDSSDPLADGVYFNFGTSNGRTFYQKFNGTSNDYGIEWTGTQWILKDLTTLTTYYTNPLDTQEPPCNAWLVNQTGYQNILVTGTPCLEIIKLTGSDQTRLNGDYIESGTLNTRNTYTNVNGATIIWNPASVYGVGWELVEGGTVYYHTAFNIVQPPCTTLATWNPVLGNDPIILKGDCAQFLPSDVIITGSSTPVNVNQFYYGTYTRILKATIDGKSVYENPFNLFFGALTIEWDDPAMEWRLGYAGSFALHTNSGTDAEPPCTGWTDYLSGGNTVSISLSNNCSFSVAAPVEWLGFQVQEKANAIELEWSTALEINNEGFGIERSLVTDPAAESLQWKELSFLPGKGDSQEQQKYSYKDSPLSPGTYLYRIRQVDYNGSYSYSPIREISFKPSTNSFTVFPNPSQGKLFLSRPHTGVQIFPTRVSIVHSSGQRLSAPITESGEVDISLLPTGMYYLEVLGNGGKMERCKFIKKS
ncbi:MAG: T9SS type A sorting domain-containing protein [Bacteroidota bacterium]